jgi:glycosyltransferase involved in cell wall biosynthesis
MIRVAALTSGRDLPSARFRIRQHIRPLHEHGIMVREFAPAIDKARPVPCWPQNISPKYILPLYGVWEGLKLATRLPGLIGSWSADVTWLGRELLPGYPTLEPLLKRPFIFDVDDAVWLARPFGAATIAGIAKRADLTIAGNSYLAEWLSRFSRNVQILPTAVNTEVYQPSKQTPNREENFVIGWIGTAGNLPYLEALEAPLARFLREKSKVELLIVADARPKFKNMPEGKVRFMPWSEKTEVESIQSMTVGLMPLPDTDWARGKCSFKMLQYMSCGLPVIVSPVGMNASILAMGEIGLQAKNENDWYHALTELYLDPKCCKALGQNGRKIVEENFSVEVVSKKIAEIMYGISIN